MTVEADQCNNCGHFQEHHFDPWRKAPYQFVEYKCGRTGEAITNKFGKCDDHARA